MSQATWLLIDILVPIVGGIILAVLPLYERKTREIVTMIFVVATSILTYWILLNPPSDFLVVGQITDELSIRLRVDGLSTAFAGLIAGLWPFACIFAFEYMTHEGREKTFFAFYTATYGVTLGIAFSANVFTLYLFYELLTLITLPLVIHSMNAASIRAGYTYIKYSIGGAAAAFVCFTALTFFGASEFVYGGNLSMEGTAGNRNFLLLMYVVGFFGFGVKAAIFPFQAWLPKASVAPTPVTALLHAVAVVKSGVFAVMRITYYSFGADYLRGSWAQWIVMIFALITILYGSTMGVKEQHIKRRLAYSTVSNLSYILFGVSLMSPWGLLGGLLHMIFHGIMKITLFFCAGAILYQTHKEYLDEIEGVGQKMPLVFGIFTIASLALTGVPPLNGFVSKWYLIIAAARNGQVLPGIGIGVLLISALLTTIYLLSIIIKAFFPVEGFQVAKLQGIKDPNWYMTLPLTIFTIAIIGFGVYSGPITSLFERIAMGR